MKPHYNIVFWAHNEICVYNKKIIIKKVLYIGSIDSGSLAYFVYIY